MKLLHNNTLVYLKGKKMDVEKIYITCIIPKIISLLPKRISKLILVQVWLFDDKNLKPIFKKKKPLIDIAYKGFFCRSYTIHEI